jgi:hypothetical protein
MEKIIIYEFKRFDWMLLFSVVGGFKTALFALSRLFEPLFYSQFDQILYSELEDSTDVTYDQFIKEMTFSLSYLG